MRLFLLFSACSSALMVLFGGYLICEADNLVRTAEVRQIGQYLRWSGCWAEGRRGCVFKPSYEEWQSNFTTSGWVLVSAGAAFGALSFWRLVKKAPKVTIRAGPSPIAAHFGRA
jgi:hypothetical protein